MKALLIKNSAIEGFGFYEDYFVSKNIKYNIFEAYENRKFPESKEFDIFIIGGTPVSVNEFNEHLFLKNEKNYLENIIRKNKPCIGICFGCQFIAKILGAKVIKSPVTEIGIYDVNLTDEGSRDNYFKNFPENFKVFQWHNDSFELPERAKLLVEGRECKNQAFSTGKILGIQFHLEISSSEASLWADKYSNELKTTGKEKNIILKQLKFYETEMKNLAYKLMDNFLKNV